MIRKKTVSWEKKKKGSTYSQIYKALIGSVKSDKALLEVSLRSSTMTGIDKIEISW
jgi:hypothetical protein